jgi:endonuclease-3
MQESFDFAAGSAGADIAFMRRRLARFFGPLKSFARRPPIWQLTRSLIGAQTYDRDTEAALKTLMWRWPDPAGIADADADAKAVLLYIHNVTHAEVKAVQLVETIRRIGRERRDFDLGFLKEWSVRHALDWLERFPGVGPKVAASTLNASTLAMPVFIVDSHVHRILLRFGFIGARATAEQGRDAVTAALDDAEALLDLFVRLKRLGQTVCRPSQPRCRTCPLAAQCQQKTHLGRPADEAPMYAFPSRAIARRADSFPGGTLNGV